MAGGAVAGTRDRKEGLLSPQTLTQARGLLLHPSACRHPWGGVTDGFPSPGGRGWGLAKGPSSSCHTRDCPHTRAVPQDTSTQGLCSAAGERTRTIAKSLAVQPPRTGLGSGQCGWGGCAG